MHEMRDVANALRGGSAPVYHVVVPALVLPDDLARRPTAYFELVGA